MTVKLLTEHHLRFLSLKEDCTGSPEPTLVKMLHCWKSHVVAQLSAVRHVTDYATWPGIYKLGHGLIFKCCDHNIFYIN